MARGIGGPEDVINPDTSVMRPTDTRKAGTA
jgi:hypothetical protein